MVAFSTPRNTDTERLEPGLMRDVLATHATRLRYHAVTRWGAGWDEAPDGDVWHLVGGGRQPFCGAVRAERSSLAKACPDCLSAAALLGDLGPLSADLDRPDPWWSATDIARMLGEDQR